MSNHGKTAQNARVVSTILDPVGQASGQSGPQPPRSIARDGEQTFEQQITVASPQLWSLEERNLYTLVTEVRADGDVVDRYETPFGIRTSNSTRRRAFSSTANP